jgi:hypothetical protein
VSGRTVYTYVGNDPLDKTDPSGQTPGDEFDSRDAAAKDAINFINPKSIQENREYGGRISETKDGKFVAATPDHGKGASVELKPVEKNDVGDYHTHGDWSKADANGDPVRSTKDKDQFNSGHFSGDESKGTGDKGGIAADAKEAKANGHSDYAGYLGTPDKQVLKYDPKTDKETKLQ